ncbi:MAG: hypothetical protein WDN31_04830, partial [Hyphomicrobium sp.]
VLADLPLPNPQGADSANLFRSLRADKNNSDKMDLKLDSPLNASMSVFARLSHRKSNYLQGPTIPAASGGDGNGYIRALNQQLVPGMDLDHDSFILIGSSLRPVQDARR